MLFDDLQDFLHVRPGQVFGGGDDLVATPFLLAGSTPLVVNVRHMPGGLFMVHDDGIVAQRHEKLLERWLSEEWSAYRNVQESAGVQIDEEGHIFAIARDASDISRAAARVMETAIGLDAAAQASEKC